MGQMIVIQPDGTEEITLIDSVPSLDVLQGAVGGLIQPVDSFIEQEDVQAFVNEEGRLRGLLPNLEGSLRVSWPIGETNHWTGDRVQPLRGPVLILKGFTDEDWE